MFLFALRNLFLQRKRYALMALAVAVGFMLITVLTGLSYGALETIKTKAARYFSGHIIVYGFENTGMSIPDSKSYVDTSVAAGTTYYYKVVPVTKSAGLTLVGAYSASVNAKAK